MDKDYFTMRAHLYNITTDLEVSFKLNDVANIWFCTTKNAKRKLQQYQAKKNAYLSSWARPRKCFKDYFS